MYTELSKLLLGPAEIAAPKLLGCQLVRTIDGNQIKTVIVETEAYDQHDAASHSYKGRTPRTDVMFGPPGRLYVYFTYGMHYCCNVVCGPEETGSAVLIRAVEPVTDNEIMVANRGGKKGIELTNGPQSFARHCRSTRLIMDTIYLLSLLNCCRASRLWIVKLCDRHELV